MGRTLLLWTEPNNSIFYHELNTLSNLHNCQDHKTSPKREHKMHLLLKCIQVVIAFKAKQLRQVTGNHLLDWFIIRFIFVTKLTPEKDLSLPVVNWLDDFKRICTMSLLI